MEQPSSEYPEMSSVMLLYRAICRLRSAMTRTCNVCFHEAVADAHVTKSPASLPSSTIMS